MRGIPLTTFIDMIYSGIYCIRNIKNNKKYIGRSKNLRKRIKEHFNELNRNRDNSRLLQKAWNKYGRNNFEWNIIVLCNENELNNLEKYYIDKYDSHFSKSGYNLSLGGEASMTGLKHSEETKKKISENNKGEKNPNFGNKMSDESKKSISDKHKGLKHSEETKLKMSNSKKGKHTGIGRKLSEEHKLNISKSGKGLKRTDATKKNVALAKQGIKNKKYTSSKYVGVCYRKKYNNWAANINAPFGTRIAIGVFVTEVEAALAYNEAAIEFYGWKAKLNDISKEEIEKLWND